MRHGRTNPVVLLCIAVVCCIIQSTMNTLTNVDTARTMRELNRIQIERDKGQDEAILNKAKNQAEMDTGWKLLNKGQPLPAPGD